MQIDTALIVSVKQKERSPSFNIGIGHIAKAVEDSGVQVKVLDLLVEDYSYEEIKDRLLEMKADIVLLSALSTQYAEIISISRLINRVRPEWPIVLGGHLATHSAETVLSNSSVNVCVLGEGERTIVDLLKNYKCLNSVEGIAFLDSDKFIKTPPREIIENLDDIGMPAYHLFNVASYVEKSAAFYCQYGQSINVITTRGCPFDCHYCCKSFPGTRVKSLDLIYEEINFLKKNYEVKNIMFNDELTILNKERGYEICKIMKDQGLTWSCQGRVNILDRELLRTMKMSGCVAVGFGVETGSPKILKNMNKRISIDQSINTLRNAIMYGPPPIVQAMFGYVGENSETLRETESFFQRVPYPSPGFFVTTPLPGTPLYEDCKNKELIGDEHEYLLRLDVGYMPGRKPLVNLSEIPDENYRRIKTEFERRINRRFWFSWLRHPVIFLNVCEALIRKNIILVLSLVRRGRFWERVRKRLFNTCG